MEAQAMVSFAKLVFCVVHPVADPATGKEVVRGLPDSKEESEDLKIVTAKTVVVVMVVVVVHGLVVELLVVLALEL